MSTRIVTIREKVGLKLHFETKSNEPTSADKKEIEYLRKLKIRMNLISPKFIHSSTTSKNNLYKIILKRVVLALLGKFPSGSTGRNKLIKIYNAMPHIIRNQVIQSVPRPNLIESAIAYSVDLGFALPTNSNPRVSIVIPVYNNWWTTYRCLRALQSNSDITPYEVIVVDDGSTDLTSYALQNMRGIRVIKNLENLGYLLSTNRGALAAQGQYILLLNNDTEPISGWLDDLVAMMDSKNDAAIIGSNLIFENGLLQESGGQIFDNANAWNLGRNKNPNSPLFRFTREVDYCSGAAILVRKTFWDQVGGYDKDFAPAYCEDSNLALQAWNMGMKVLVCPTSWVIHTEGVSHGNNTNQGLKKYQVINSRKLFAKNELALRSHWPDEGKPRLEAKRNSKGIIVLCDRQAPSQFRDAGSIRTLQLVSQLQELGYHVVLSMLDFSTNEIELAELEKNGVEIHKSIESLIESIQLRQSRIKLFWFIRSEVIDYYFSKLTNIAPNVPVISDLIDLNFEFKNGNKIIVNTQLENARRSDMSLLCSSVEVEMLKEKCPDLKVQALWAIYQSKTKRSNFESGEGILFVGGFRHIPNVQALEFYLDKILPILKDRGVDEKTYIVGSGLEQDLINRVNQAGLIYLGRVDDLESLYSQAKIVIAPLISGGGRKGKIGEALSYGLPIVTTSIGAEGFNFRGDNEVFVADDPDSFANYVINLVNDSQLRREMGENSIKYCEEFLSEVKFKMEISNILEELIK